MQLSKGDELFFVTIFVGICAALGYMCSSF